MGDAAMCDQLFADGGEVQQCYHPSDADDLFSILETWEDCVYGGGAAAAAQLSPIAFFAGAGGPVAADRAAATVGYDSRKRPAPSGDDEDDGRNAREEKRQKKAAAAADDEEEDGAAPKTSHITVERNRRKQMNEHLAVLRSLMPCFYVKRGDQASIIGGVVDYIKELQQVLHSLESKKQRKAYTDQVIPSPRPPPSCSPRLPLSPRPPPLLKSTPPLSPRLPVPVSPRTPPTPGSPYLHLRSLLPAPPPAGSAYASPAMTPTHEAASSYLPSLDAIAAELSAYAGKQAPPPPTGAGLLPDVRVEFAGANLVLKTASHRAPGQAVKIISALEGRSLEILHAKISTVDDTAVNSFTVKIGIECELSAEELVQEIQQTFSLSGTN